MVCRVVVVAAVACAAVAAAARPSPADEFRVETSVFVGKKKEPVSRNTTYFSAGVVYDFLLAPTEITVFDPARRRMVLLDPSRQIKAELSTEEILKLNADMQSVAERSSIPFLKFVARPEFQTEQDEQAGSLTLSSEMLTYRVISQKAKTETAAMQYRRFADWYARMKPLVQPGAMPPAARLELNRRIAANRWIPQQVHRTIRTQTGPIRRTTTAHSEHAVRWFLDESDTKRIESARRDLASFKLVSLEEYRRRTSTDANRPANVK
jgi:hypothetical protein